jgi:hypothetical protein
MISLPKLPCSNEVDPAPFPEKLRESGFYVQWRSKFGEEACRC